MASRDEIVSFCNQLLEIDGFEDYCPNGLQVPGREQIEAVVSGVSANAELLRAARESGAGLVLAHHGVFWDSGTRALSLGLAERLRILLGERISLAAYHLPLDAHPEIGNNALLCEGLALERGERFGSVKGAELGFVGRLAEGKVARAELVERVRSLTDREPLCFDEGPEEIGAIGIVSGGGGSLLEEAASRGLDAMLSGEAGEPSLSIARENSINFIAAGHHATETFSVRRLGELVAERFGVRHEFVDVPNPV
ncbi:MAG: Nif3-like dinuclear metal center hexameric protein [Solirubrobacterales bacterium]